MRAAISLIIGKLEARGLLQLTLARVCPQVQRLTPRLAYEGAIRRIVAPLAPLATMIPPVKLGVSGAYGGETT